MPLFSSCNLLFYIGVELISDVVSVLGVQKLDSVIYKHLFLFRFFFPHIGDCSVFSRVTRAIL